jgi:hypothetical protein
VNEGYDTGNPIPQKRTIPKIGLHICILLHVL